MEFEKNRLTEKQKKIYGRVADLPELEGQYRLLSHEVYTIERKRTLTEETRSIDMFGPGWLFFRANSKDGNIAIVQDGKKKVLGPNIIGYVPGKNVIEWIMPKCEIEYEMLVCEIPLERGAPLKPVCFSYENSEKSIFDLFEIFFDKLEDANALSLERTTKPSKLALQAQDWIHKNWRINFKLQDLAEELNTSPSVLSRYFKAAFGLSPLKYVNKLRIITSVRDLLKSQRSISQISYDMGFGDPRQFNEHFRQIYPVKPFAFRK